MNLNQRQINIADAIIREAGNSGSTTPLEIHKLLYWDYNEDKITEKEVVQVARALRKEGLVNLRLNLWTNPRTIKLTKKGSMHYSLRQGIQTYIEEKKSLYNIKIVFLIIILFILIIKYSC